MSSCRHCIQGPAGLSLAGSESTNPIWANLTFADQVSFLIAGVPIISRGGNAAGRRLFQQGLGDDCALSDSDNIECAHLLLSPPGNRPRYGRWFFPAAELVFRGPNHQVARFVGGGQSAGGSSQRSRLSSSPTRTIQGLFAQGERKASAEADGVRGGPSRWFHQRTLYSCTNSIGSSMVRMWSGRLSLVWFDHAGERGGFAEPASP